MLAAADGAALERVYANAQRARHEWITAIESGVTNRERQSQESGK
jgi:prephenate dehydrogenase